MGRSQVLFNRRHGRPGRGRSDGGSGRGGGRVRGRDRGGGVGGHDNREHRQGSAMKNLGDNSWRYEEENKVQGEGNDHVEDSSGDDSASEADDGITSAALLRGEYGPSHAAVQLGGDDALDEDFIKNTKAGRDTSSHDDEEAPSERIDLVQLSKILSTLSSSTRLRLFPHIGRMLDAELGSTQADGKRTLAQMQADPTNTINACSPLHDKLNQKQLGQMNLPSTHTRQDNVVHHTENRQQQDALPNDNKHKQHLDEKDEIQTPPQNHVNHQEEVNDEEQEEDLDAWLDSVIS